MEKVIRVVFILIFVFSLGLSLVFMNTEKDAVSEIDNKVLTNNPLIYGVDEGQDLTEALEIYVSERIGGRAARILTDTIVNDKLYDEMIHPTYEYGKDGYVFFKCGDNVEYSEYQDAFGETNGYKPRNKKNINNKNKENYEQYKLDL